MPTFKHLVAALDQARKIEFVELSVIPENELSPEQERRKNLAPIANNNTIFLMPHGEPFFEDLYAGLQERQNYNDTSHPKIHFGIGGTRNLSIMAATRADGAILADLNLNHQKLMDTIGEVAEQLIHNHGVGNFTPEDFVEAFSRHPVQQDVLAKIPASQGLHTDLAQELAVAESWLYAGQTDGRFDHIMRLYEQERIGTIALNIVDEGAFEGLACVLQKAREHICGLENAELDTIFLANLMRHLAKPSGAYRHFENDTTPRGQEPRAWNNIGIIADCGNPYTILADRTILEAIKIPDSPFFNNRQISGISFNQFQERSREINFDAPPDESIVSYREGELHHCDWNHGNQITIGGGLGIMRRLLEQQHKIDYPVGKHTENVVTRQTIAREK